MARRLLAIWFPRLASDTVLRSTPIEGAFALVRRTGGADRILCLNRVAEKTGLARGMPLADARALTPDLLTRIEDPEQTRAMLETLRRWAERYSPHIAADDDGLLADITGIPHLFGDEGGLRDDLHARLDRAGFAARSAIADTRGAAHALARHGGTLPRLPVAALRIPPTMAEALTRLGIRTIGDLLPLPRAPLARRFGAELILRLDQFTGHLPEPVAAPNPQPHFATRMVLPDPIGLHSDVMAGLARLLAPLCAKLARFEMGACRLRLELRRVDRSTLAAEIGLAQPMRDPDRIANLFSPKLQDLDAGFGIDALRLVVTIAEPLAPAQVSDRPLKTDALADYASRVGNRIGFGNVFQIVPTDSLIPERSFRHAPATMPSQGALPPKLIFPPEPVIGNPPHTFRWREQGFEACALTGPERIAPDWWDEDPAWALGLRDYWRIHTRQGRRLWLFHTPQHPAWFAQGEFA